MEKLDLLRGTLDMLVLRVLSGGPMHGWSIA
jgi:DNA-binding PadR family transcriptional regulator